MIQLLALTLSAAFFVLGTKVAEAQDHYRWLDKCGNVHYTQTPPPRDQELCQAPPPAPSKRFEPTKQPIPLDSEDPRYSVYLRQVRAKIKAHWAYPCVKQEAAGGCEYKAAKLTIEFGLFQDGRVAYATVVANAAWPVYDEHAVNAIQQASPFPPVPVDLVAPVQPGARA